MLPRQRAFNKRKQQSSRNQLNKYNDDHSPSKGKKKLINKMDGGYGGGKYSKGGSKKGNYLRVNSGGNRNESDRMKSMKSRSIGKDKGSKKRSMEKKGSKNNLISKKKNSKSSLSQNKRPRGGSQKNKRKPKTKPKQKQEDFYQV